MANMEQKTARFVPVTLGIVNGTQAEVINPPLSGPVVTLGHHLLEDGAKIILPGERPKAGPHGKLGKPDVKRGKIPAAGEKS